ncbi:MAG: UPF0280 family protein, partial [Alphaproteobacteria bacterium]
AVEVFDGVLEALVAELPLLRADVRGAPRPRGQVARAMTRAVRRFPERFVTPMAAVAGAVADHVLAAMRRGRSLARASVNNGGDIAIWLAPGEAFRIAVAADPVTGDRAGTVRVRAGDGIGGIATSGWRGRSHSLGIADAVTVLASDAATADAAATLIANAVDLPGDARIARSPACELAPDSDLGARLVTVDVPVLDAASVERALAAGAARARAYIDAGRVRAAFLTLQGRSVTVGAASGLIGKE